MRRLLVLLSLFSGAAMATPVDYYGAIFNLSIAGAGPSYTVTYTADFTGFTNGANQPFIDSIAWKVEGADVATVSLVSGPGSGWVATADSHVSAGGCSTSGGNNWACAQDGTSPYVATTGSYSWIFNATFTGNLTGILDTTGDSIKARFVNADGTKQQDLLSCRLDDTPCTSSVPEPATLGLLGLGLLGVGMARRHRRS